MKMKRSAYNHLKTWTNLKDRRPILLRGARQVGKSHLVRQLAENFDQFLELNFEEKPNAKIIFEGPLTPSEIIPKIEGLLNKKIEPGRTLLFFDEIQDCPHAITALRYFYEKMPELHVIAAGSLLDFELDKIGVPVGRVEFLFINPLSFDEFCVALGEDVLLEQKYQFSKISDVAHQRLLELIRIYSLVGGMPAVVESYRVTRSFIECQRIQNVILNTYRQDFSKYAKKQQIQHIEKVFDAVPRLLGQKLKYSHISSEAKSQTINDALALLCKARVVFKNFHSAANGVPLGSEVNFQHFKCVFIDIGLALRMLGIDLPQLVTLSTIELINKGAIAEQFVGQEILANMPPTESPQLYHWHREARTSNAEVDYVIQHQSRVLPIEVKAGATGRLKSLNQFLLEKPQHKLGLRIHSGPIEEHGKILSLPFYLLGNFLQRSAQETHLLGSS